MRIDGASALITGGASGLGAAVAATFRAGGADVTIADRDAAAGQVRAKAIGAHFVEVDVTDEASARAAVDKAAAAMRAGASR